MKISFDMLYQLSFLFGSDIMPKIFKAFGVPEKYYTTASGHCSLWTGILLGIGGALIAGGAIIGLVSGAALAAPAVAGTTLLYGTLGMGAMAIGAGLFNAGEKALGLPWSANAKQLWDFFRNLRKPAVKNDGPQLPPAPSAQLIASFSQPASSFSMTKRLVQNFKDAVSGKKPQMAAKPCKPAFEGPTL